jgi:hypothetical protein
MNNLTRFTKLTAPEKRGRYKLESVVKTKEEIAFILKEVEYKQAVGYFAVGERLVAMKEKLGHGKFMAYVENKFPYCQRVANTYMLLFDYYKDDPASLASLGYREALMKAGIIKPKEGVVASVVDSLLPLEPLPPYHQLKFDYVYIFQQKPLNMNVRNMKNFRLMVMEDEIALFEKDVKGFRAAAKLNVFGKNDPRMKQHYKIASEKIQMALEEYFQLYEFALLEDELKMKKALNKKKEKSGA